VKYYAVAEIDITDPDWVPSYVERVTRLVEERGGRYLARTPRSERLEGDRTPPQIFLIIEWPSRAAAVAFYESDDYRPHRGRRILGARSDFALVAGEDVTGAARIA
jgi:uncharacterized protein (DUF1330 family)